MIDIETPQEIEVISNGIDVEARSLEVEVVDLKELDITVAKKEFVITGDDIYVPKLYDDAPQWMKDLVQIVVNSAMDTGNASTLAQLASMLSQFATSYVPLNQYTQSIIDLSNEDANIHSVIETLNSNYNNGLSQANAQIISLQNTKASKDEVIAEVVSTLSAQLANPTSVLGATIGNLQQTVVDNQNANALSMQALTASIEGVSGDVAGNATAIHTLNTYVGVENGTSNGTGLLADVVILQKQNDGVIETTTGTYDVMINPQDPNLAELVVTAEPYASWKAADVTGIDTRLAHIGDVYIKYGVTSNGAKEYVGSYKFIRTVVDVTDAHKSTDADGFTWALIVDQAAQDAYNQALNAYDLADNKRRVFTTTPYGPYDIGDLWTKTVSGGSTLYKATVKRVSGYVSGDWVVADDAGLNTFVSTTYTPTVTSLQNQVDGKVESWYTLSTSDPKAAWTDAATRFKHDGDLWYQTDTKSSYWYSSSTNAWNLIDDAKAIQALADAATAQATADGKISSYYVATFADAQTLSNGWTATEKTSNTGDLVVVWNDSTLDNNGTWRWNGTSWVNTRDKKLVSLASDVTTLRTDLDSGTGTWAAGDSTVTNNLTTTINNGLATVESKWAYNSSLNINGVSYNSGFGLSNSAGTGAGSEFWINADKLKFTNNGKTGSKAPFTIDASGPQPQVTFNGKVTFGSGQTGTIDEAIAAVVETVAVGDKNINITDNLIPITSLVADTDNSGYQFIGTPTKSNTAGIDTYAEAQIVLDGSDEVYSPYVDDTTISYYYRFGIKGITNGSVFKIVTINSSNVATNNTVTITMNSGQSITAGNWYIIEGMINPTGGSSAAVGSIRNSSGVKIGTVSSLALPSGTSKVVLGWVANCTVSRLKLCKVTADTVTSDLTMVNGQLSTLQSNIDNISWSSLQGKDLMAQQQGFANYTDMTNKYSALGKTIINGGYINTGLVNANSIVANSVSADRLVAGTSNSTVWTGGGLVSQNFNGNSYGNIGSPTQGFRLSSDAAGTSSDPNIYGAYIKGGTIDGTTFIGALTETTVYHNFSATAPGNSTWKQVASFTANAPTSGERFKLTASLTFGAAGGNWPDVRFRVSFNSVLVLNSTSLSSALGGVSDTTLFIKSSTSYTSNVTVTVEAYQASGGGYAYINTSSRISCMMMATSI